MPPGELGDHEQADPAVGQQAGDVHLVGVGEQRVHPVLLADGHPEATVLDLDGQSGGDQVRPQQHLGVRGGEHGRVLDEFGEQVDDVGDRVSAQGAVGRGHELDPRVLLDLGDRRAQHLGHGHRVAPLPPGDGPAEHGEVLRVAADAGGEVVDVEEPLEQVGVLHLVLQLVENGDLAVDEGLQAPGEVDEHLELLFAARLAGELRRLHHGGDRAVVGAGEVGGELVELVAVAAAFGAPAARGRRLAVAQRLDEGVQVRLAPCRAAAQDAHAVVHGAGRALGGHGGDDDAGEGHGGGAAEHRPQGAVRPHPAGADGEQHGGAGAQGHRDGRQHGEPEQLGPYVRLGQAGRGPGGRTSVPPALAPLRPGGGAVAAGAGAGGRGLRGGAALRDAGHDRAADRPRVSGLLTPSAPSSALWLHVPVPAP